MNRFTAIVWRRLLRAVPIVLLVTFFTSVIVNLLPGNAAVAILGTNATAQNVKQLSSQLGLNQPVMVRYVEWLWGVLRGHFGTSLLTGIPVKTEIVRALPVSIELVIGAEILALLIAVPSAIYGAYRSGGIVDRIMNVVISVLLSAPAFVTGPLLAVMFAVTVHIFPVEGWVPLTASFGENLRTAFLPALALALPQAAVFNRVFRADVVTILEQDYIRFARAKGLSPAYILTRHAARPASISLVTLVGLSIGNLIGGTLIVETLFSLPGMGQLLVTAVFSRDIQVVQGGVLVIALTYIVMNLLVDLSYGLLDPRIR